MKALQGGYVFNCKCIACERKFPLVNGLKKENFLSDGTLEQVIKACKVGMHDDNLKRTITKFLCEFNSVHPCFETCMLQTALSNLIYFTFCSEDVET